MSIYFEINILLSFKLVCIFVYAKSFSNYRNSRRIINRNQFLYWKRGGVIARGRIEKVVYWKVWGGRGSYCERAYCERAY